MASNTTMDSHISTDGHTIWDFLDNNDGYLYDVKFPTAVDCCVITFHTKQTFDQSKASVNQSAGCLNVQVTQLQITQHKQNHQEPLTCNHEVETDSMRKIIKNITQQNEQLINQNTELKTKLEDQSKLTNITKTTSSLAPATKHGNCADAQITNSAILSLQQEIMQQKVNKLQYNRTRWCSKTKDGHNKE
ncbi:hypothetical protein ACF0H5_005631 [Mactra antiquata]